jgi:hypothetical protein
MGATMIRNIVVFVCVVAAFTVGGICLRVRSAKVTAISKGRQVSLPTVPFIATRSDVTVLAGNPVPVSSEILTIAVRSDGSIVELAHRKDPSGKRNTVYIRTILDVPNKQRVIVEPISESLIKYPLVDQAVSAYAVRGMAQCAGTLTSPILGYAVALEEEAQTGAGNDEVKVRSWRAPQLDCTPLRREIIILKGGTEVQRITRTVLTVTEGEPDKSLFEIPQGYVERQPSEAMAEAARRYPNDPDWRCPNCSQTQRHKDEAYWKHRVQQQSTKP